MGLIYTPRRGLDAAVDCALDRGYVFRGNIVPLDRIDTVARGTLPHQRSALRYLRGMQSVRQEELRELYEAACNLTTVSPEVAARIIQRTSDGRSFPALLLKGYFGTKDPEGATETLEEGFGIPGFGLYELPVDISDFATITFQPESYRAQPQA